MQTLTSPGPPYTMHNAWDLVTSEGKPGRFTGRYQNSTGTQWINYSEWGVTSSISFSNNPAANHTAYFLGNQQRWLNAALAAVNFTKPIVPIANFAWELKEFPSMLRDAGRVLGARGIRPSDAPGAHIAWQFGWAPLIQDLTTLMNLGLEIEKAQQRFLSAKSQKKLSGSILNSVRSEIVSNAAVVTGSTGSKTEWQVTDRVWYTAHWDLFSESPNPYFGHIYSQYTTALGLNRPYAIIWEAMPWSWLIDYFTDFGTVIEVSGGLAEYRPDKICLMWQAEAKVLRDELFFTNNLTGSYSPIEYRCTQKKRTVHSDPMARPIFDIWGFVPHTAILGSLVTAKALRRAGS
jgi:hypothetical protein